jgi:hypothetical protein
MHFISITARNAIIASGAALCISTATAAFADPIVDGTISAGEYGAPTSTVLYDPAAPISNFQNPTNTATVGYSVYLNATNGYLYGALQTSALQGGTGAPDFANLYFDLDPQNNNGSDLGFSMGAGGVTAFIPGGNNVQVVLTNVQFVAGTGGTVLEFAIPNIDFEMPIAGLTYASGQAFPNSQNPDVVLRLSQSFGYSVAGGASYGATRLGEAALQDGSSVPEPAGLAVLLPAIAAFIGLKRRKPLSAAA